MNISIIKNSKVLVTGGAGFIGSNLCEVLLKQGNEVVCLDNFSNGHRSNIEAFLGNSSFRLIEGDIRNYEDCQEAANGCEYVLHQAALGSVPRSIKDPMTSTDVNIGGFVKMLHASVEAGVKRFVYAASSSTYGDHPDLPKIEHKIGRSLSPYAITKYVDELFAANFSKIYGIETVGLRYFNVFGRNQDPFGAYAAVIPKFVIQLLKQESPLINGDGSFSRDFTYIDNVLLANQLAATTATELILERQQSYYKAVGEAVPEEGALSEVFNVACGGNISLTDLFNILKTNLARFDKKVADVQVQFGPQRSGDIPHSQASIEKGKQLFDYHPVYNAVEGLELATEWYWNNYRNLIKDSSIR
ncbi:SDR family NAD(P)-dependent oxidoreductase [Desertivirga arenae]|uniref:SDR family NAD(P)-dependent oxidoreductase n=1 Tax=Desertivirga arenae TaxID=2810309 RepID=UPI00350F6051